MQQLQNEDNAVYLNQVIKQLEAVNKRIAKLNLMKEQLTSEVIAGFDHHHEGQKSYEFECWKVEIKTPVTYSLDKKKYESGKFVLPDEYNPIRTSISYSIDKKACEKYISDAPKKVRDSLVSLIDKKPAKASVVIKARV